MNVTIHTATYNRAYILGQAYESLKKQTCKDFEWIITDDGSTDETEKLVNQWMGEYNGFEIIYNKLEHVGIPRALNSGVNKATTEWFMMLDSDDYFLPEAVERVTGWIHEIADDESFVGIGFAKCYPDGKYMKNQEPLVDHETGYIDATNIERKKYNLDMEMAEVTRVSLLKQYPFRCWETEKYAPEQLNYNAIALLGYKYRWHKEKLCVCEYLSDGQTRDNKIVKNNPMGFAMMYNQNLLIHNGFLNKFRDAMQMTALCLYSGNNQYLKETNSKFYTIISYPAGLLLSKRRKKQFEKM